MTMLLFLNVQSRKSTSMKTKNSTSSWLNLFSSNKRQRQIVVLDNYDNCSTLQNDTYTYIVINYKRTTIYH